MSAHYLSLGSCAKRIIANEQMMLTIRVDHVSHERYKSDETALLGKGAKVGTLEFTTDGAE